MSVPQDQLAAMQAGQAAPPPGMPNPSGGAPGSSPMSVPSENGGEKAKAMAVMKISMMLLQQALPLFGAETKEGGTVLDVLKKLASHFGDSHGGNLVPAQLGMMLQNMPQAGGGSPEMQAMMQAAKGGPAGAGGPPGAG